MNIIYMEIDCDSLVQRYLLLKNPLYTFNFPISILIAIIVFGFAKAYKFSDNSYIKSNINSSCSIIIMHGIFRYNIKGNGIKNR